MMSVKNKAISSIKELVSEDGLKAYSIRFDIDDQGKSFYDLKSFVNALMFELSDFAYGGDYWPNAAPGNPAEAINEAARAIYQIKEFKDAAALYARGESLDDSVWDRIIRRGEFGELILFFLLRHFNDALPLLSKIYFKDADGFAVHGFDAVHYQESTSSLWLGESKCYESSKNGLAALVGDIKEHFCAEYLNREFTFVAKKFKGAELAQGKRDEIVGQLNSQRSLTDKLKTINIPLLCTFSSPSLASYEEETEEFLKAFSDEMQDLKSHFDSINDHPLKDRLNIILLLMPVKSKRDLVGAIHERLTFAQGIIQ